jgi:hypothetical protein
MWDYKRQWLGFPLAAEPHPFKTSIDILYVFIKNMLAVINCTRFKSTFSIRDIIGFRGMPLWIMVCLGSVINLVTMGDLWYRFFR